MKNASSRLVNGVAVALVIVACCVAVIPLSPSFPDADLDSAWKFALNAAIAQRKVFGRDIIFTFGPYASVYTDSYHPQTDVLAMVSGTILAGALAGGLLVLTQGMWRWLAILLAVTLSYLPMHDPIFLLLPMLFVAVAAAPQKKGPKSAAAILLLAAALAILILVKATFAAAAVVGLAGGGVILLLHRRWSVAFATALTSLVVFFSAWMIAHQPLWALPVFFRGESEVVSGYTDAMSLAGPGWQVAVYGLAAGSLLVMNAPAFRRAGWPGMVMAFASGVLLLLAFKAGFVRQDEHVIIAAGSLAACGFVLAFLHRSGLAMTALCVALLGAGAIDYSAQGAGPRAALQNLETIYALAWHGLLDRATSGSDRINEYAAALAHVRAQHPLPPLSGSTDIYSVGQSVVLASGLPWSPRPALQSYTAYTADLAMKDAQHLEDIFAPDNVLLRLEPTDNRYPSLEDGPSWLPLMQNYRLSAMLGDTALLHKILLKPNFSLLGQHNTQSSQMLNEPVEIPQGEPPLWAWIDVKPTALGRLASAFFKSPPLGLTLKLENGQTLSFRFIPGMARAGFLLTPLIADAVQLLALKVPEGHAWNDRVPLSFTLNGDAAYWNTRYSLTTTPLVLPQSDDLVAKIFLPPKTAAPSTTFDSKCYLDAINGTVIDWTKPSELRGLVRFTGWAYGSAAHGVEPKTISMTFRGSDGSFLSAPAILENRPDIGVYFHQPGLAMVGFQGLVDLRGFRGSFLLGARGSAAGISWDCNLANIVVAGP